MVVLITLIGQGQEPPPRTGTRVPVAVPPTRTPVPRPPVVVAPLPPPVAPPVVTPPVVQPVRQTVNRKPAPRPMAPPPLEKMIKRQIADALRTARMATPKFARHTLWFG
ncbi:hypothetical protein EV193_10793 [Herbihabitans rhizosphaerae]|uniref:Uncharacterized protein n=2 Tax=Herbihabitans rhizosphaerae TaxID=1872711 RepID=A0A4Q7KMI7_9PSEU|nr:hypothetical protein EV193_10793 [Herbihabitans rhizosphaerae]